MFENLLWILYVVALLHKTKDLNNICAQLSTPLVRWYNFSVAAYVELYIDLT